MFKVKKSTWALMRATRKLFLLSNMDFSRRHSWAWPCEAHTGWWNMFLRMFVYVCICMCVTYQHKVDVEVKDLVAHVHTEVVAKMVSQVGESPSWALEVCAGHFHPLDGEQRVSETVCMYSTCVCLLWLCICVSYLLRYPVIHGSQHGVQGPYRESTNTFSEVWRLSF